LTGVPFVELVYHLLEDRRIAHHQVIGEQHRKGLVADQPLPAQHRMAESQGLGLADVDALHVVRFDASNHVQ
jgi:hypothetical protein